MLQDGVLVAPLLVWTKVLVVCTGSLLCVAVAIVTVGWVLHLSNGARLAALLPVAASVGAGVAATHVYDRYLYWLPWDRGVLEYRVSPGYVTYLLQGTQTAVHEATVLGWLVIVVIGMFLALGTVGLMLDRHRASVGSKS